MRILRVGAAAATAALAAVACGSTTTTPSAPAATPTPSGPPKAVFTLTGPASLAGLVTINTVECSFPSVAGEEIIVNATAGAATPTALRLTLTASSVTVLLDTGSGSSFRARQFSGTGVTQFDAATGAQFTGPLSDTTPAGGNSAGIGTLTNIAGSVDCAGQTPGSSTLAISGTVPQGSISGALTSVRVVCIPSNNEVETYGLIQVGGAPSLAAVFAFSGRFTMDLAPPSVPAEFFTSAESATATTAGSTATINGDATESVAAGATASTVHVTGQSTCGSSTTP